MRTTNPLILSYNGTCCIYQSDLNILQSDTEWLNDSCINFQMIRLSERNAPTPPTPPAVPPPPLTTHKPHEMAESAALENSNDDDDDDKQQQQRPRVVFIDPCIVSFFVHQINTDDEADEDDRDEILNLYRNTWKLGPHRRRHPPQHKHKQPPRRQTRTKKNASLLMIPINDNHAVSHQTTPGAGNHWSLLAVLVYEEEDRPTPRRPTDGTRSIAQRHQRWNCGRYFHFDSKRGTNRNAARIVATRVECILSIGSNASEDDDGSGGGEGVVGGGTGETASAAIVVDNVDDAEECVSREFSPKRLKRSATSVGVVECSTPQQSNGYDCGLCTLANAEALSAAIDGLPRRRRHGDDDGDDDDMNDDEDKDEDKVLKKWFEQTLKGFTVGGCGSIGKMSKAIRRSIAADVMQLKTESNNVQ